MKTRILAAATMAALLVSSCFNVTSPDSPPHPVDPPVIKCTTTTPKEPSCDASSVSEASADDAAIDDAMADDGSTDASAPIVLGNCDAGAQGQPSYDECSLPPSTCADSHWAAYFDDGICVKGYCQLTTKYHYCPGGCANGYCVTGISGTLARRGF